MLKLTSKSEQVSVCINMHFIWQWF